MNPDLRYIDIHSHLNLEPLASRQAEVLAKMRDQGVGTITVGTGLATSREAVRIAEENPGVCFATVGLHPCHICADDEDSHDRESDDATDHDGEIFEPEAFRDLATHSSVVAIGETGLDYFRTDAANADSRAVRKIQEDVFKQHIELAVAVDKPLMLHVRASRGTDDAYFDALAILADYEPGGPLHDPEHDAPLRANFHFFSGSAECMQAIVARGYTVSVDGPITFSSDYDEMIRECPLESLMAETDAPFAAPSPYRGQTCEPWMVVEVAKKIAEIKGLDEKQVRRQLLENAQGFFGL